jgi:VWFA-related protein
MRISGWVLLASVAAALAGPLEAQSAATDAPAVRIVSPGRDDIPMGETTISVRVTGFAPGDVVEVFADGRLVGRITGEPWSVAWKAPDNPRPHNLAAILLREGREAAASRVRTRGLGFSASAKARAVSLSPIITDAGGHYVRGLAKDEFSLLVDGRPQRIETFEEVNSPLSVVLVVDVSTSMTVKIVKARKAALELLAALKPNDQAAVLTFSSKVVGFTDFSTDKSSARAALEKARVDGETALYDATGVALRRLKEASGRRAVVLFTDGEDNRSRMSVDRVIDLARASEACVFAVGQGVDEARPLVRALNRMAEETGGRTWFISTIDNISAVFREVVAELENQYFLTFTPSDQRPGTWHQMVLRVTRPGLKVRARKSFLID